MKLATFTHDGNRRIGVVDGEEIVDLAAAAAGVPTDMRSFLQAGQPALEAAAAAATAGGHRIARADVKLEAPVPDPRKFIGIGANYAAHLAEVNQPPVERGGPPLGFIFTKQNSCVNGPYDPIHMPRVSSQLDYEGELGMVIGRRCRHVPKERAAEVIAGYVVANDVSVRDQATGAFSFTLTKSFDTHGPFGPWIVTADEVGDPNNLELRTWVSGEERQHANTKDMVHDCYDLIATLSAVFTLEPGDVIATGTPSGVAIGFDPPKFLKVGDVVRVEIERIGVIENRVIAEPEETARID
ncbi:MAG: fumarylacetoacetate hydrolase family protein [Dehalococcoidia bacterium]